MGKAAFEEIDWQAIRTESLVDRPSKVSVAQLGGAPPLNVDVSAFGESLPDILASKDIKQVINAIVQCIVSRCRSSSVTGRIYSRGCAGAWWGPRSS